MLALTDIHLVWAVLLTSFSVQFQFSPGWIINSSGLVCEVQGSWRSFSGHPCVTGVSYHHQHSELVLMQNSPESVSLLPLFGSWWWGFIITDPAMLTKLTLLLNQTVVRSKSWSFWHDSICLCLQPSLPFCVVPVFVKEWKNIFFSSQEIRK